MYGEPDSNSVLWGGYRKDAPSKELKMCLGNLVCQPRDHIETAVIKRNLAEQEKCFSLTHSELLSGRLSHAGSMGIFPLRPGGQRDQRLVK